MINHRRSNKSTGDLDGGWGGTWVGGGEGVGAGVAYYWEK